MSKVYWQGRVAYHYLQVLPCVLDCNKVFAFVLAAGKVRWSLYTAKLNLERTSSCAF
jgi:hypothetical protein